MDLIPNSVFRILSDPRNDEAYASGLYRVVMDDIQGGTTIAVHIASGEDLDGESNAANSKLVGQLIWMQRDHLLALSECGQIKPVELYRTDPPELSSAGRTAFEERVEIMSSFLDMQSLHDGITDSQSLGKLVTKVMEEHGVSRSFVYKQWSLLCRFGFHQNSLIPGYSRCGAKGVPRPCTHSSDQEHASRKKGGRKTVEQRAALAYGIHLDPVQPGMSAEWAAAIRAADARIPNPKPKWPNRIKRIYSTAFCSKIICNEQGTFSYVLPELGKYPNKAQIKHTLTHGVDTLTRLMERTTKHHFQMARRGLVARSWEGVAGPNHTWAIDSTVADIYLRSSIDRRWIVGRPIVYVVVDMWSTAVVGFYVCLTGPSWSTAKVSLFNSSASPAVVIIPFCKGLRSRNVTQPWPVAALV